MLGNISHFLNRLFNPFYDAFNVNNEKTKHTDHDDDHHHHHSHTGHMDDHSKDDGHDCQGHDHDHDHSSDAGYEAIIAHQKMHDDGLAYVFRNQQGRFLNSWGIGRILNIFNAPKSNKPLEATAETAPYWTPKKIAKHLNRTGNQWTVAKKGKTKITFSFITDRNTLYGVGQKMINVKGKEVDVVRDESRGFRVFSDKQKEAARAALAEWAKVANIEFVEVTEGKDKKGKHVKGQIRFANTTSGPQFAWAYLPGGFAGGEVWVNNSRFQNNLFGRGQSAHFILMHEIGHALGLSHPGDYNGSDFGVDRKDYVQDNHQYTVMSYYNHPFMKYSNPAGPGMHDILAIQRIYGKNTTHNNGRNVYQWNPKQKIVDTLYDTGGDDTIDISNQTQDFQVVDLRPGYFSSVGVSNILLQTARYNVGIGHDVIIENAIGSQKNDTLIGNNINNILIGKDGHDDIIGGAGDDLLNGGSGNDRYFFGKNWGRDIIIDYNGKNQIIFEGLKRQDLYVHRKRNVLVITQKMDANTLTGNTIFINKFFDNRDKFDFFLTDKIKQTHKHFNIPAYVLKAMQREAQKTAVNKTTEQSVISKDVHLSSSNLRRLNKPQNMNRFNIFGG